MDNTQEKSACFDSQSDHIEDAQTAEPQVKDLDDPHNWPQWKVSGPRKEINFALLTFHSLMTNFVGAGIIPAYTIFAEEFGVTVSEVSYFTSIHILFTGLFPFVLVPFSNSIQHWLREEYRLYHYAESFHEDKRSIRMGVWAVMITLGPPLGPLLMAFVTERAGWQWIYWIFAIISGVQFVLQVFLGSETRYVKDSGTSSKSKGIRESFAVRRIDLSPFTWAEFYRPIKHIKCISMLVPIYAHSMIFNIVAGMLTVEIPQLFAERFNFGAEQIGLQFIGIITGTVLAEFFNAAVLCTMRRRAARRHDKMPRPVNFLLVSYLGFVCVIAGLVAFCICMGNTKPLHYNVTPIIGIGVAGFGNQVVATFLVNYVIQVHTENTSSVSILLGFLRQTWSFIGPFWFPSMFENLGMHGSAGLLVGIKRGFRVDHSIPANLIVSMSDEKSSEFFIHQSETCMMQWQRVTETFHFQFLDFSKTIGFIDNFEFFVLKILCMTSTRVEIRSHRKSARLMLEIERKCKTARCSKFDETRTIAKSQ
ncbi:uncharacterized protein N7477_009645 [Penicillium maclennaniae]|uniref:uncharacterized protein n=1 Tax=Penicillium maclennaniae TaxID=1343394 RepID=UPI00253FC0F3|nr:uncharacterized protein N7477_009645 [Penicillium maclennaniae]KAJ5662029.1 hypothetical protein N7477_009645 [Penicillium maclennaniae]